MHTYRDQPYEHDKSKEREICNKSRSVKQPQQVFEGACGLRDDTKDCDEHCATGDEECAEDHPWREYVAKKQPGKKCVPKEGDRAERGENDDRERGDLEDRSE